MHRVLNENNAIHADATACKGALEVLFPYAKVHGTLFAHHSVAARHSDAQCRADGVDGRILVLYAEQAERELAVLSQWFLVDEHLFRRIR